MPIAATLQFVQGAATRGRRFYAQQKESTQRNEGGFSPLGYHATLAVAWRVAVLSPWRFGWAVRFLPMVPLVGAALADWVAKRDFFVVVDLLGVVVAYVLSDRRSRHLTACQRILGGSVDAVRALLRAAPPGAASPFDRYAQIALVAHSLGTQIAIDTLNRLNLLATQGRLPTACGAPASLAARLPLLLTFGSPADTLARFFRDLSVPGPAPARQYPLGAGLQSPRPGERPHRR